MATAVSSAEISTLKSVEKLIFVVFSYVEDEWPEACVFVGAVLFPCGCSPDGDYHASACFSYFYC